MRTKATLVAERARRVRFRRLVEQAVRSLPTAIRQQLDNVEIVVESEPSSEQSGHNDGGCVDLFGLYEGVPLSDRDSSYSLVLPDRIVIFQGPLERAFSNPLVIAEEIRITVLHELAHHFGFDEEAVERLGLE
jgi:predicted Zn-dependent protease with MMP-like domain